MNFVPKDVKNKKQKGKDDEDDKEGKPFSLRLDVEAGDCLMINTRLWWHRTELPPSGNPSISVARDFYCDERRPKAGLAMWGGTAVGTSENKNKKGNGGKGQNAKGGGSSNN